MFHVRITLVKREWTWIQSFRWVLPQGSLLSWLSFPSCTQWSYTTVQQSSDVFVTCRKTILPGTKSTMRRMWCCGTLNCEWLITWSPFLEQGAVTAKLVPVTQALLGTYYTVPAKLDSPSMAFQRTHWACKLASCWRICAMLLLVLLLQHERWCCMSSSGCGTRSSGLV